MILTHFEATEWASLLSRQKQEAVPCRHHLPPRNIPAPAPARCRDIRFPPIEGVVVDGVCYEPWIYDRGRSSGYGTFEVEGGKSASSE